MAECHENPDFFHNLLHLALPFGPYAFASDLPMLYRIKGQVHCSKGSSTKALRSNNIPSYALAGRQEYEVECEK